ncbi:MAG: alkaline phosphatase PhoX, partial [Actinomycetes bacterium]
TAVRDAATGLALLELPKGFEYVTGSWTNDPMTGGTGRVPSTHDGMAAFSTPGGLVTLVRNHERGSGVPFGGPAYNGSASGGTTTLQFDPRRGTFLDTVPSLSGTIRNCAGGPTPQGTWLTCEETTSTVDGVPHGYVFEVPASGAGNPVPYKEMGRFSHEAVAVDPETGIVYETEDAGPTSGFYRFVPRVPGELGKGGTLQMLKIGSSAYTTNADDTGTAYNHVSWVTIDQPDPALPGGQTVYQQGRAKGGAQFARLEGAWYDKRTIWFISTSGGPAGQGQVFAYDVRSERLSVVYASPSAEVLNAPDNMCVSPRGGIVLCEDGSGREYVHGLTQRGEIFRFALNDVVLTAEDVARAGKLVAPGDYTGSEWCGATFSEDGDWLFVNVQSPGITFAITGPWGRGLL